MKVSLKKAFSLLDGRLSTEMGDVYEMLNYIYTDNFMTHQLPTAMRKLEKFNPPWFADGVSVIDGIKQANSTNDFQKLMTIIDNEFSAYEIELGKIDERIDFMSGLENLNTITK